MERLIGIGICSAQKKEEQFVKGIHLVLCYNKILLQENFANKLKKSLLIFFERNIWGPFF